MMALMAHMIMVSSRDIAKLREFYEDGLGWAPHTPPSRLSVMYSVGSSLLVFIDEAYQAKESGLPATAQAKALYATFVASKEEVHAIVDRAVAAGGVVTSPIRDRDLGLYSGYFADPEGNGWEVVYGPAMKLDDAGGLILPG